MNFLEKARTAIDQLNKYNLIVQKHAQKPRNRGALVNPDGTAEYLGPCGDTMAFDIYVEDNFITDIRFRTDGCGSSIACGSMTAQLAEGKTLDEARRIEQHDVLKALGGLPEDSQHCALLAATTLKLAVANFMRKAREDDR